MRFASISLGVVCVLLAIAAPFVASTSSGLLGEDVARARLIRHEVSGHGSQPPIYEPVHADEHTQADWQEKLKTAALNVDGPPSYEHVHVQNTSHGIHEKIERQAQWAERLERHSAHEHTNMERTSTNDEKVVAEAAKHLGAMNWKGDAVMANLGNRPKKSVSLTKAEDATAVHTCLQNDLEKQPPYCDMVESVNTPSMVCWDFPLYMAFRAGVIGKNKDGCGGPDKKCGTILQTYVDAMVVGTMQSMDPIFKQMIAAKTPWNNNPPYMMRATQLAANGFYGLAAAQNVVQGNLNPGAIVAWFKIDVPDIPVHMALAATATQVYSLWNVPKRKNAGIPGNQGTACNPNDTACQLYNHLQLIDLDEVSAYVGCDQQTATVGHPLPANCAAIVKQVASPWAGR